jgi:hypothetical protein
VPLPVEAYPFDNPDERLFRRISPKEAWTRWEGDPTIWNDQIDFPKSSINRERFSEPEDLLKPRWPVYSRHGIAVCRVCDVPPSLPEDPSLTYALVYCPEYGNDAHSEIRAYRNGVELKDKKEATATVRSRFRAVLGERLKVYRLPGTEYSPK